VSPLDVLGKRRGDGIMEPRQVAMFLARHCTLQSFPQIARAMHRDHTTVMHGVERVRERIALDARFAVSVAQIEAEVLRTSDLAFPEPARTPPPPPASRGGPADQATIRLWALDHGVRINAVGPLTQVDMALVNNRRRLLDLAPFTLLTMREAV
uniref:helix-turn-helix domain-containing protein n=1 Tax=Bosea sp. (in: a-proteobacteria) TaxID=1871050 RepID=UPI0025BB1DF2